MQTTRTPYSVSFMATVLLLLLFACHSTIANAAVALGATRVIYPANQKQVLLPVTNNDPASVYLIQSWIENAGDQKDTQFVITPPLFSMQGKKENTLRIINATNHQLPGDRESLFWVNVKAIPAMEKDQKNENTLQLAIISRIKMFYRPTHLAMAPEEAPAMLRFRRSGSKLTLINPTPYFITVTNMKAGNSNLPNTMVPPKGEVSVDIPHAVTGDISLLKRLRPPAAYFSEERSSLEEVLLAFPHSDQAVVCPYQVIVVSAVSEELFVLPDCARYPAFRLPSKGFLALAGSSMTVKTESSAAAFSDANMPPANITMAGTVFKSFIYQESVQQKKRPSRSRKLS